MAKTLEDFKKELESNVLLAAEFGKILNACSKAGKTPEELAKELLEFLKKKGFELTEKEILNFVKKETKKIIPDSLLSKISGGYIPLCN